jgi:hypothetical protein
VAKTEEVVSNGKSLVQQYNTHHEVDVVVDNLMGDMT